MKKFYTIMAALMMAAASFAQDFTVTADGKPVENGTTLNVNYDVYPVKWIVPNVIGTYNLDPELKIHADKDVEVAITVSDDIKDGVLQNCAFGQCIPVTASNCPVTANGTAKAGDTDVAAHLTYGSNNPGANLQRAFNVEIKSAGTTVAFKVQFNIGTYAGVREVEADNANGAIYSIGGVRMQSEATAGKIYIKNGKKYVK